MVFGLFLRRMPRARRKASPRPLRPLCVWLCVAKMRDRDETGTHSVHDLWPERVHPMQGNLPRNPKESERRMVKQPQSSHWAGDKVWPHPFVGRIQGRRGLSPHLLLHAHLLTSWGSPFPRDATVLPSEKLPRTERCDNDSENGKPTSGVPIFILLVLFVKCGGSMAEPSVQTIRFRIPFRQRILRVFLKI